MERTKISSRQTAKRHTRGFTLLEILMVIMLIGLLASAVVPNFTKVFRVSVQSSVRRYAALVRFTYDQSVLTGRIHRIVLNMDDQSWRVEAAEPGALPLDKLKVGLMPEGLRDDDRVLNEPQFQKAKSDFVDALPKGVALVQVSSWRLGTGSKADATSGEVSIYAFPNGYMDEATVVLAEAGKELSQQFKVTTVPLTGRVKIESETKTR